MKKTTIIALMVILLTGFLLRRHNYSTWPREGATFDEHAWTWLGLSLIETGVPTSWSPHKPYTLRVPFRDAKGASYLLVTPYLEHPPVFGLVAGASAKLQGVSFMGDIELHKIRRLSLVLGVLSIGLVFWLGRRLHSDTVGILSSGVYAIMPTVAVGSRLVQNENFFIPLFLLSLIAIAEYIASHKRIFLIIGSVIVALLPLAKVPWVAASVAVIAFLLSRKKFADSVVVLAFTASAFAIFFLWGFQWDGEVFRNLWKLQLARYDITFDGVYALLTSPLAVDRYLLDGWIFAGWGSLLIILLKDWKKYSLLLFGFLAYFGMYLVGIPNEPGHGWYRYPFYPFLALSLGILIKEYFGKQPFVTFMILIATGLSGFAISWQKAFGFSYGVYRGYILLAALSLLPIVFEEPWAIKLSKFVSFALLAFVCVLSVWGILLYSEQ